MLLVIDQGGDGIVRHEDSGSESSWMLTKSKYGEAAPDSPSKRIIREKEGENPVGMHLSVH
jgi:hypothetical protein